MNISRYAEVEWSEGSLNNMMPVKATRTVFRSGA
jgi:hypothetical protein